MVLSFECRTTLGAAEDAATLASRWQGKGAYTGVDAWANTTLKEGTIVYGGVPGQSGFVTTAEGIVASEQNAASLFKGLQVAPNPTLGYRPGVTMYRVTADTEAAFSQALANPQFGSGGLPQYYIPNFKSLEPVLSIPLKR